MDDDGDDNSNGGADDDGGADINDGNGANGGDGVSKNCCDGGVDGGGGNTNHVDGIDRNCVFDTKGVEEADAGALDECNRSSKMEMRVGKMQWRNLKETQR